MLDPKFIRKDPDRIRRMLKERNATVDLDGLLALDRRVRSDTGRVNELKHSKNEIAQAIGREKDPVKKRSLIEQTRLVVDEIRTIDGKLHEEEEERMRLLMTVPNLPLEGVPVGKGEEDNRIIREVGKRPQFDFEPHSHGLIGEKLGILDLKQGIKVAGSGFYLLRGNGARLERALIQYMLDTHREQGYIELLPPVLVNREAMKGTGQLPKFEDDMYHCETDDLFLVPTAEVPITNLHANEILHNSDLPIYYQGYTPCFRRESGRHASEGGIIRVHQFNKIELVKFCRPEASPRELEGLLEDAGSVLEGLGLPYRVLELCTGDLSFSSARTYDLEVWIAGQGDWLEVSSCSTFQDFQARRANIRFRRKPHLPTEYLHTLNGSGLAVGRTMVAILENYQNKDGSVSVPEVLRQYMGGLETIGVEPKIPRGMG